MRTGEIVSRSLSFFHLLLHTATSFSQKYSFVQEVKVGPMIEPNAILRND